MSLTPGYGGPSEEFHAGEVKTLLLSNNRSPSGEDKNMCFVNSAYNILRVIPRFRYIFYFNYLWVYMSHSFDCKNLQNESYDVTLSMKQQKPPARAS